MENATATATMAKRRSVGGRPPEPEPLRGLISLKGTNAMEEWIDNLVDRTRQGTRTLLLKNALRAFAEQHGIDDPMPRR